ncbi:hypothetical protein BSKO_07461 [Bryopsis sp. KO-2023]|nr:hypothetical protein BSKO_07461 [Bryopsis sp. KO-2023]
MVVHNTRIELLQLNDDASFAGAIGRLIADPFLTATGKKLLGSLCNRKRHETVQFYATANFDTIAQVEISPKWIALNLCTYPNTGMRYRQAVDALVEHLGGPASLFRQEERTVVLPGLLLGDGLESTWKELAARYDFDCQQMDCVAYDFEEGPEVEMEEERQQHAMILNMNGLYLDSLKESDAPLVDKCWPFGKNGKGAFVRNLVENFPSTCARRRDTHEPVAWCLQYWYGSLGNLYVTTPWRRKGLGSVLAKAQAENIVRSTGNDKLARHWVHAWVVAKNVGGQQMFDGLASFKQRHDRICYFRMESKRRKSQDTVIGAGL